MADELLDPAVRQMIIDQIAIELDAEYTARVTEIEVENNRLRGEIATLRERLISVNRVKETV